MGLIGVSGKAKAGKDLLCSFANKDGWTRLAFADALKNKVKREFGLEEDHVNGWLKEAETDLLNGHSPRELMIDIGNIYRKYDPNYWVKTVLDVIKSNPTKKIMITDVRFPNEADAIRNHGGILVRLNRHPKRDNLVSDETKKSISETALDNYKKWDFELEAQNNETPDQLAAFWQVVSAAIGMKL